MAEVSKSQVDRLGDRLRSGPASEADLRMLEEFRRSFGEAYGSVTEIIESHRLPFKGRPQKSTLSITAKLRREEASKLSRMQDIAGCRIVVPDRLTQNRVAETLQKDFTKVIIKDRRESPSHGYRALHMIATSDMRLVEIQIRTVLQQSWAELSEKAFDVIDPAIKYGGGPEEFRLLLLKWSNEVADFEERELFYRQREWLTHAESYPLNVYAPEIAEPEREELYRRRGTIEMTLSVIMLSLERMRGPSEQHDDIFS